MENKIWGNLSDFLKSEEGKKSMEEYFDGIKKSRLIKKTQLERFHQKFGEEEKFTELLDKVIKKYDSDEYLNKWYNRGYEPPMYFYEFFFEYAKIYGKEATKREYKKYGCTFTTQMYFIFGYYFDLIQGQGSAILIHKKKRK